VKLFVPTVKAGGHKEQSFVRDETINTDVVRCLQYAFTFQSDLFRLCSQELRGVTWGEGDRSRPEVHGARLALANP